MDFFCSDEVGDQPPWSYDEEEVSVLPNFNQSYLCIYFEIYAYGMTWAENWCIVPILSEENAEIERFFNMEITASLDVAPRM
ncbi:hypothetical protein BUALT_Bualt03G0147100 [Buddleja alternifolia]|uniref:Uncharacterized protein n=1 Tax=Buddleja alternifolia TaxID=168488 RepID=A0AAV6Y1V9_9LAMI|nr:hypothetical protein BUALT_Bualt03G0147100 [Buddleja alternifolia]